MLGDSKKAYNIVLDKAVKNDIDRIAKSTNRSSSNLINHILNDYIKSIKKKAKARSEQRKRQEQTT